MGLYRLVLPKMGESVSEATLTTWLKEVGDRIDEDDAVVEVSTDKVDSDVPSPISGTLKERLFEVNQVIQVGEAIAIIEIDGNDKAFAEHTTRHAESSILQSAPESGEEIVAEEGKQNIPGLDLLAQDKTHSSNHDETVVEDNRFYSPLVRSIAQQEGIALADLRTIDGSGADGRVTKEDILAFVKQKSDGLKTGQQQHTPPAVSHQTEKGSGSNETAGASIGQSSVKDAPKPNRVKVGETDEIIEMDRMRRLIADHMVQSVQTSPHVFSAIEVDVTNLVKWRNSIKDDFKKREGENITFTPLLIEAVTRAIKDFPMVNVSVDGYSIIKRKHINIGMAAALPSGNLIVPVIKDADQLSLVGLTKTVNDLANRARGNKLKPDDTQGGTFTFTNIGAFGNTFGMPIINQPQTAILAVGTIKKKPMVLETENGDVIAIRHMMYITMSYDHRVIDGALGGTFIKRVADYLEDWDIHRTV